MAEIELRESKTLKALTQMTKPARPSDIAKTLGDIPLNTGNSVRKLAQSGLAELVDKKGNTWRLTDKGKETLANLEGNPETATLLQQAITVQQEPPTKTETPTPTPSAIREPPPAIPPSEEQPETVPSQADLLRAEGQRIGFGSRKGDIKLDAVVNYVERIADLDDLSSVWNALTEMGVASNVRKTWIKLYAQNLPNKEIPEELKERLEVGHEAEKVTIESAVAAKPKRFSIVNGQVIGDPEGDYSFKEALQLLDQEKGASPAQARFSVVNGQIIGDSEGDYNFKEALQLLAQEKGASPAQAGEMAATFAKMNTDTMNLLIPLLTKEPKDDSVIKLLIPLLTKDSKDDSVIKLILTQMGDLQKEIRAASSQGQGSSEVQALSQQLSELRDTLHNEQLARIQEQNQATTKELIGYIKGLENKIAAANEGKQVESRIGLMSKALDTGADELKGIRQDIKPLAQSFMERRAAPGERTPGEKVGFGAGLDKGMERAREATQLEQELFFTGGPASE